MKAFVLLALLLIFPQTSEKIVATCSVVPYEGSATRLICYEKEKQFQMEIPKSEYTIKGCRDIFLYRNAQTQGLKFVHNQLKGCKINRTADSIKTCKQHVAEKFCGKGIPDCRLPSIAMSDLHECEQ